MKKKYFPLISILILVMLFGTAAICNRCGITTTTESTSAQVTEEDKTKEELIKIEEEKAKQAEIESIQEQDAKAKQAAIESEQQAKDSQETTSSNAAAPTIRLQIYEGPTYSEAGDICLYKLEAIVTGSPTPTVTFSKDDSNGTWGSKKVQINIQRSQPYTLTATATNSAGSASGSINLSWGCGSESGNTETTEETGGESGPTVLSMIVPSVAAEGGYKADDGSPSYAGGPLYAGDSNTNEGIVGYISFDITGLPVPNIHTASLTFNVGQIHGNPSIYPGFVVGSAYWGTIPITSATPLRFISTFQEISSTSGNFTIDNEALKTSLQAAIDAGHPRFQIAITTGGDVPVTNLDNNWDGIEWAQSGVILNITYLH